MFFLDSRRIVHTTLVLLLSVFVLNPTPAKAKVRLSGNQCFDDAVAETLNGGDLQTILRRYISVPSIAANAAWKRWRVRWNELDEQRKQATIAAVNNALRRVSRDFFADINLSTLVARSKRVRNGTLVWGRYNTRGGGSDAFEMNITNECIVYRVVYNNISLSGYVSSQIKD